MNRPGQRVESVKQRRCRCVQEFVIDAVNTPLARRCRFLPSASGDNLLQRHPISRSAPGRDHNVRIKRCNFLVANMGVGTGDELASSRFCQLCDPFLRRNNRFPPLFAEDFKTWKSGRFRPYFLDPRLHGRDQPLAALVLPNHTGDHRNVFVDVGQILRREGEKRHACLQDLAHRLFLVGN
jgi:hypothetical protein